jgi:hypothetical protein
VQVLLAGIEAPLNFIPVAPAAKAPPVKLVNAPAPVHELLVVVLASVNPDGNVSVNDVIAKAELFGLLKRIATGVVPPRATDAVGVAMLPNALFTDGKPTDRVAVVATALEPILVVVKPPMGIVLT